MPPMIITAAIGDHEIGSFDVGYYSYNKETNTYIYRWCVGDECGDIEHNRPDGWMVLAKKIIDDYINTRDGRQYKMPKWAVMQVLRDDKAFLVEDVCTHGCGHPNAEWIKQHAADDSSLSIHGCDGCCGVSLPKKDSILKRIVKKIRG